jgi:hypothetical protein
MTNKTMAHDFSAVNNDREILCYNIISSNEVELTYRQGNPYRGDINIPTTVTHKGNTYSVTAISFLAFPFCSDLTSVIIPHSVTSIGENTFFFCSRLISISVNVNNTAYSSTNGVLFNKDQTTLICFPAGKTGVYTIPYTVTVIGNSAFYSCSRLTSVTIPNSVTTIGSSAFYSCSRLISVIISNSVATIGEGAFCDCSSLTSVTIPNSVTTIGDFAFLGCSSLTNIYVKAVTPPQIFEYTFGGVNKSIPVYVCGSAEDYKNTDYWSEFTNIIEDNNCNTNIEALSLTHKISVYPNPATNIINITLPENIHQAVFMLCDMQAKILIKQNISNRDAVSVNNLATGSYIYNVITDKQKYVGKLIINVSNEQ